MTCNTIFNLLTLHYAGEGGAVMGVTDKTMIEGLQFVAEFMNAAAPTTRRPAWRHYLRRYIRALEAKGHTLAFGPLVDRPDDRIRRYKARLTLREAKQVQQEVLPVFHYLDFDRLGVQLPSDPVDPAIEQPFGRTSEHPFGPLMLRLTQRFTQGQWKCKSSGSSLPEPGQSVLRFKRRDGRIERWTASYSPFGEPESLQELIYTILGKAFLSGLLGQFRMCPVCARYFVAWGKAAKRINCSDSCKEERGSNGAARVRRSREAKRGRMLERARTMVKEGNNLRAIKQAIPLPERVLEALFREIGRV